jgi:Zn-dependent protease
MWLLTGSVSLGNWFGINVRLHAALILVLVISLIAPGTIGGPYNSLTFCIVLFASVLLHEFGHCAGSRMVGGSPTEIILTPLGGAALADAPKRPWATFVTVICGPAVNLLLCLISAAVIWFVAHAPGSLPWNILHHGLLSFVPPHPLAHAAWWVFTVNYGLLLFNLIPLFPLLDGGQLVQSLLWVKLGYYRATLIACTVGIVTGIVMVMVALVSGVNILLLVIAANGLFNAVIMRSQLKAAGPWAFEEEAGEDYSASLWNESPASHTTTRHKHLSKRSLKKAQRRAKQAELEQARIDAILAKVSAHGMHSLTWRERRALHKATERQRMLETSGPSRKHHW